MRSIKEIKNAVPLDQKLTFFAQKLILRSASPQPAPASPSSQYQPVPAPTQFSKMWFQKENRSKVWVKTFGQNFRSKLSVKTFRSKLSVKTFGQNVSVKTFGQNLLAPKPLTISINPKPSSPAFAPLPGAVARQATGVGGLLRSSSKLM